MDLIHVQRMGKMSCHSTWHYRLVLKSVKIADIVKKKLLPVMKPVLSVKDNMARLRLLVRIKLVVL